MIRTLLVVFAIIAAYYGLKAAWNAFMIKFAVASKLGALRAMINPRKFIRTSFGIIWKVIKYGTVFMILVTIVGILLRG